VAEMRKSEPSIILHKLYDLFLDPNCPPLARLTFLLTFCTSILMSKHKKKEKTDKQKRDRSQKKNASTQNDNPKPAKQLKEKAEPIRKSKFEETVLLLRINLFFIGSRLAGPSASSIG